jgi:von Willebrand factor type A domain
MATNERLGPAERIIQTLLSYSDHMVHNRPGIVRPDNKLEVGVRWEPVTHKEERGQKTVYQLQKVGKKSLKTAVGVLRDDGKIVNGREVVGEYRPAGIFPEVATWMYAQVADVWTLDNEFAARWASYAFGQEHRDLKVVLAAFLLVQSRKGDPVVEGGKVAFHDEDYRDVGEAMMLMVKKDGKDLNPKLLLRIHDVLSLPGIAAINRELGFGKSARRAPLGRWDKAVEKWLRHREENPRLLQGLVKAGFRTSVMELARHVGYKPSTKKFFETLRWKQKQSDDGRRSISIGEDVAPAETWAGLDEEAICEKIVKEKPSFKRIVGLLPKEIGLTRAVVAASIEAGSLSDKDLVIYTPTLEELGLLKVQEIRERWERAVNAAEDMRAANIASRVKSKETKEKLVEASDTVLKKAVEEATKNIRVYFLVDVSGSMQSSIEKAKSHIARFLQGFPMDRIHVAVFNTQGREIRVPHASAAGVENAFRGIVAGGGTDYGSGVYALAHHKPKDDEDTLLFFVGDEGQHGQFATAVLVSGLRPMAFALVRLPGENFGVVTRTAAELGIPCFDVGEETFTDTYAIPRTVRALVASTPVGAAARTALVRVSLAETILKTELLKKPVWAT